MWQDSHHRDVVHAVRRYVALLLVTIEPVEGESGVVWCGVVWCGVVWCGVVWCGVVWCGVVWCGVVWCGVVWCGVPKALLPKGNGQDGLAHGEMQAGAGV